jgi:hypothetical protein
MAKRPVKMTRVRDALSMLKALSDLYRGRHIDNRKFSSDVAVTCTKFMEEVMEANYRPSHEEWKQITITLGYALSIMNMEPDKRRPFVAQAIGPDGVMTVIAGSHPVGNRGEEQ